MSRYNSSKYNKFLKGGYFYEEPELIEFKKIEPTESNENQSSEIEEYVNVPQEVFQNMLNIVNRAEENGYVSKHTTKNIVSQINNNNKTLYGGYFDSSTSEYSTMDYLAGGYYYENTPTLTETEPVYESSYTLTPTPTSPSESPIHNKKNNNKKEIEEILSKLLETTTPQTPPPQSNKNNKKEKTSGGYYKKYRNYY
jgi:hypothetical protein